MLTDAAFDFIAGLNGQPDAPTLIGAFQTLIHDHGFENFCIGIPTQPHLRRDDRIWAASCSEDWVKRYLSQRYELIDPLVRRLNGVTGPFRWGEVRASADPAGLRMMDEATEFGICDGLALPIRSREGTTVAIAISGRHYDLGARDEAALHMASLYFQARLAQLRMPSAPLGDVAKLTPRERECLSWVASGKTDWEISQILNISEQTAHEYMQNAISKLNATTRAQAVAVAMLTRQILQ